MATYCFVCTVCGERVQQHERVEPSDEHGIMRRDYQAEAVGFQTVQLKAERSAGGRVAMRDSVLPSAKDFASPSDPEGQKGIREWNETHVPRPSNKRPMRPETQKQVF